MTATTTLTLTPDQQQAYEAFSSFILTPHESVFVLSGYSGTGKSTLVSHLVEELPNLFKMLKTIDPGNKNYNWSIALTATTNKAAEAFSYLTGQDVTTIHSFLGIRVQTDYKTGENRLALSRSAGGPVTNHVIFIDEASYVDKQLLDLIFKRTKNCKVVFIGDPAQIAPVRSNRTPVFEAGFPEVKLSKVVRQVEGNPIIDLATRFRNTVNTGEFFSFTPDGQHIQYLDREEFDQAIVKEFDDPTWKYTRSKVLAWTNKAVIVYNKAIRNLVKGNPEFQVGDYAICNQYIKKFNSNYQLKTDQLVHITKIGSHHHSESGLDGHLIEVNHVEEFFMPHSLQEKNRVLNQARKSNAWGLVQEITNEWIDLRAAYAQTINKSQGSTYDMVFIDLDDVKKCRNGNLLARMLYVAVSRARYRVVLTGDIL